MPKIIKTNLCFVLFVCALSATLFPKDAQAFCGFYVSGGDSALFNDATQVVMMREGTKTILSMQNNYKGPAKHFAMVVPVPVVLQEEHVKTLPPTIFSKVDQMTAPRLVAYWEKDPCGVFDENNRFMESFDAGASAQNNASPPVDDGTVKVEAEFAVGEYEIVLLSATQGSALDMWLHDEGYNIPQGAAPLFKQYIEQGMYFFVAKVDPAKVVYKNGEAVLSPLRFDYDSELFSLPVRLGMVNSKGTQDLIVYILGKDQRYEVSNYKNVTIPTNIEVAKSVKDDFGSFYTKLFERTVAQNPGSVVTEYAWNASTCDPCPGPMLDDNDFATLGADTLSNSEHEGRFGSGWVITRLHARYGKDTITDDLVFKKASPILGGREHVTSSGHLETGATPGEYNNFQGRYIMRNRWTGGITCAKPQFGNWGGPPHGGTVMPSTAVSQNTASNLGKTSSHHNTSLEELVREDIPEINIQTTNTRGNLGGGCSTTSGSAIPFLAMLTFFGLFGWNMRRRRKN